jgi:hypothetical protein
MKKVGIVTFLLGLSITASAQLPFPAIPDWLKPAQKNAEVLTHTHVTLTGNNYSIIEPNVIARSKGFKLFGLITFRNASYTEAMKRLYEKAHVEAGHPQALANVVHESGSSYFILFSIPKVTIRADLIEFLDLGETCDEEMAGAIPARSSRPVRERKRERDLRGL